jgi:hypothetical protein
MEINWNLAKKKTLWQYEDLIGKLREVLDYPFVQACCNHSMPQAAAYAERIRQGYFPDSDAAFLDEVTAHFKALAGLGVRDILDLLQRVGSRAECEAFLAQSGFAFDVLIDVLNYLMRFALPFKCPVRELLDEADQADKDLLAKLRQHGLRSNLDVLEACRRRTDRQYLCAASRLSEAFLLALTHRADIARLAYVRGKTVRHLCGGGYDTLARIANAEPEKMAADMAAYYETIGKSFEDFRAVIPLGWMIGGAGILPAIVEK